MELLFGVTDKTLVGHVRGVKKVIIHPGYVAAGNHPDDIAILELSTPLTYGPACKPICLPNVAEFAVLTNCWAVGWGRTSLGGGK